MAGLHAIGATFSASDVFGTDFMSRRDGPSIARPLAWNPSCSCFQYTGGPFTIP